MIEITATHVSIYDNVFKKRKICSRKNEISEGSFTYRRCRPNREKSLGTNWNLDNAVGLEQPFSTAAPRAGKADGLIEKMAKFLSKSNPWELRLWKREFASAIHHEFS